MNTRTIIFDDGLGQLGPMTDLRAAFEIRTGFRTTAERIALRRPKTLAGYWTRPRLRELVAARANAPVNDLPSDEVVLCMNGRWILPDPALQPDVGEAIVEESTQHVVVARLRRADAEFMLEHGQLSERVRTTTLPGRILAKYPWDVMTMLRDTLRYDLEHVRFGDEGIPSEHAVVFGGHPVHLHAEATIYPNVTIDVQHGPVVIDRHAVIRPNAILCGPCAIGPGSTVQDHAIIKANTVLGPVCKVAGEVGGTVFQGYSNKGHHGFLGDSWVGEWVNFGAGTTNSNLLNTYGEVTMRLEPDGPRRRTGLTFLGGIFGDHVKTAINTSIMTGSVYGTGAMIATTAAPPTTVGRFAWLTDDGARVYRLEKFMEVMQAVMSRRGMKPSDLDRDAIAALHAAHVAKADA
ncbi:MAG: hypothetical protein KDA25_04590 [Phycisphaerales bacterium]|nr:hypothetical protein [Phycisphaerales bacterium]